ncbi:unnamed protein product, partial [marine sediment metagenome]
GKLFTSVLIGILVEKGKISYENTITQYFNDDLLSNLHVYKGNDYTNHITYIKISYRVLAFYHRFRIMEQV